MSKRKDQPFVTPKDMSKTQCVIPLSLSYKKMPPQILGALRANNFIIFKTSLCMGSEPHLIQTYRSLCDRLHKFYGSDYNHNYSSSTAVV